MYVESLSHVVAAFATSAHFRFASLGGGVFFPSLEDTVGMAGVIFFVFSQKIEVVHETVRNEHLNNDVPHDSGGSNNNTDEVLMSTQRDQLEGLSSALHNKYLKEEDTDNNSNEKIVDENIFKWVQFCLFKFTSVEEVEYLQKYKNVEK